MKKNRIIPDIIRSLEKNKKILLRNPNSTRPWQHVLEPLYGYLKLGSYLITKKLRNLESPNWNFGPYKKNCVKVKKIVGLIHQKLSIKNKIKTNKKVKFKEANLLSLKIDKAKKELKWQPKLTLKETIN